MRSHLPAECILYSSFGDIMDEEKQQRIDKIAREILTLSRNTLIVNLRFLDMALSQFTLVPNENTTLATDGQHLLYKAEHVIQCFKREKAIPIRDFLHIVLHCIYRHMFIDRFINRPLWDLACDIAVEVTITDLELPSTKAGREVHQAPFLNELKKNVNILTAEKIYHYLFEQNMTAVQAADLRGLFYADDHELWYMNEEEKEKTYGKASSEPFDDDSREGHGSEENKPSSAVEIAEDPHASSGANFWANLNGNVSETWKDISEGVLQDLQTFSREQGNKSMNLMQNLAAVNREKYNYEAFLKKFAVRGEVMKIDPDDFDYIFYTYGLQLYQDMPLIEPLEYREVKRIKEFVIAIDTSGSVEGDLVQTFIQKTYNVLKSMESFFTKINLHIIQCDAEIKEDAKITSQEDFDEYLEKMTLHGFGGTDFRPVFRYVDDLIQQKEFSNLKGLIYFTDGYGYFPEVKPSYETAFVFIDDDYTDIGVPPWAIKLVLQRDEI